MKLFQVEGPRRRTGVKKIFQKTLILVFEAGYDRFTDQPINRPINRYRPINRIGKLGKSLYRIGIGSADYKGLYRLIGYLYYNKFFRHKKNLTYAKLVQIPD